MNIDMIKEIITLIGGTGAIAFIPKLYFEYKKQKKLQEEQTINNKELQKNQHQLDKELNELKAKQNGLLFISNKQYEKEFEIYLELYGYLSDALFKFSTVTNVISEFTFYNKMEQEKLTSGISIIELGESVQKLQYQNFKYQPFFKKEVSDNIFNIIYIMREVTENVQVAYNEDRLLKLTDEYYFSDAIEKVDDLSEEVGEIIRKYLLELKHI